MSTFASIYTQYTLEKYGFCNASFRSQLSIRFGVGWVMRKQASDDEYMYVEKETLF
jgi:hypothetical protein